MCAQSQTARLCRLRYILTPWDRKHHYIQKHWPKRELLIPGQTNLVNTSLFKPKKFSLSPLYIKIEFIKKIFKAVDKKYHCTYVFEK